MEEKLTQADPAHLANGDTQLFGPSLRRHRLRAGFSQAALARASGLSVDAIAALERGRRKAPRAVTIRLLADALGLPPTDHAALVAAASPGTFSLAVMSPLPAMADGFLGRSKELKDIVALLSAPENRLVTMTGPGGVGKTSLAAVAAATHLQAEPQAICWVQLSSVPEGVSVLTTVAAQAGVVDPAGSDASAALAFRLNQSRALLVLDNCEHLLDEVAKFCALLLSRCPDLHILSTSRESFWIPGERVYAVPPLPLPPADCPVDELRSSPAVELFCLRAEALSRAPTAAEMPAVARICTQLAGIPLAIELAAARATVFSIEQLAVALDDALGLLTTGRRTAEPRHRTLANSIGWSHDLLSASERSLFARLSVFRGGWTLAAARSVGVPESMTLEVMSRLVDKSLVALQARGTETRYEMLEPIRQYAAARLADSGEEATARTKHAEFYAEFAEQMNSVQSSSAEYGSSLDRLDAEVANLEAAIAWAARRSDHAIVTRIANATWSFCAIRGRYAEGMRWLGIALAGPVTELAARAETSLGAGSLAFFCCQYDDATTHLRNALASFELAEDGPGTAQTMQRLASVARERGDYCRAEDLLQRTLASWRQIGDQTNEASTHNALAFVAWLRGDWLVAIDLARQSYRHFRRSADSEGTVWSLLNLGVAARYRRRYDEAQKLLLDALTVSDEIGFPEGTAWALNHLGAIERERGSHDRAIELLIESLSGHLTLGDRWRAASILDELGITRSLGHNWDRAAFLHGLAESMREDIGTPIPTCEADDVKQSVTAVRASISAEQFETSWEAGQNSLWRTESAVPPPSSSPRLPTIRHDLFPGTPPP